MLELYKKRWSFVESYEDRMKEIKEKTANGTLKMSKEEIEDWLGIDEMNIELFYHTTKLPVPVIRFRTGEYLDSPG